MQLKDIQQPTAQHKDGDKVIITDKAIKKVQLIHPSGLTEENALFLQEVHKEILRVSKEENNSDEVACLIDLGNHRRSEIELGDTNSVDIEHNAEIYHWLHTNPENSLILCHNHPSLEDFSMDDINVFARFNSIKLMTIITNQGKCKYIQKNTNYDVKKIYLYLQEYKKVNDSKTKRKVVDNLLKKSYDYGIERKR